MQSTKAQAWKEEFRSYDIEKWQMMTACYVWQDNNNYIYNILRGQYSMRCLRRAMIDISTYPKMYVE